jgi:hypothetical protein
MILAQSYSVFVPLTNSVSFALIKTPTNLLKQFDYRTTLLWVLKSLQIFTTLSKSKDPKILMTLSMIKFKNPYVSIYTLHFLNLLEKNLTSDVVG